MAFDPSFYNQSCVLSINIMVVDDDPIFLKLFSRKLEKSECRDPSVTNMTVIAEKTPTEALSTLKFQRNNIDLIITDYYMPFMDGLQLKHQITQEFGNLPVVVISADKDKEEESLTSGALSFFSKPIKETDITRIYQFALTYKRNGKSIMSSTELNHKETHVSIPKHIKFLPDQQANVVKTKRKYSDSRKNQKRNPNGGPSGDGEPEPPKKAKFIWTGPRHNLFVQAVAHYGHDKAVPKKILDFMNLPDLTTAIVASHLQKYRIRLRKQVVEPFYTKSEYGFAQSKTPEPVGVGQMPYMNGSSNYDLHNIGTGSNFTLPTQSNLFLPNQQFQNVERRSFFGPSLMDTKIDQTSQGFGFGLLGPTGNNFNNDMDQTSQGFGFGLLGRTGNNFNNDMMSSYGNFGSNQPGSGHFSYGSIESFLNNENPQSHACATTQLNYDLPQTDNLNNVYSDIYQTNEIPYNITSNIEFDQQQQGEDASTKFDLDFSTELNQILSLGDLVDLTSLNTNQGQLNGETSDAFAATETNPPVSDMNPSQNQFNGEASNTVSASETNPPIFNVIPDQNHLSGETSNILSATEENPSIFNMNPYQNQEQDDVSGFNNWSSWESQEWLDDGDFMSLFNNMN